MSDTQGLKSSAVSKGILVARMIAGFSVAMVVQIQMGFTGLLWGGIFGAVGAILGASIASPIAERFHRKS